jgi:hypothetical protein
MIVAQQPRSACPGWTVQGHRWTDTCACGPVQAVQGREAYCKVLQRWLAGITLNDVIYRIEEQPILENVKLVRS